MGLAQSYPPSATAATAEEDIHDALVPDTLREIVAGLHVLDRYRFAVTSRRSWNLTSKAHLLLLRPRLCGTFPSLIDYLTAADIQHTSDKDFDAVLRRVYFYDATKGSYPNSYLFTMVMGAIVSHHSGGDSLGRLAKIYDTLPKGMRLPPAYDPLLLATKLAKTQVIQYILQRPNAPKIDAKVWKSYSSAPWQRRRALLSIVGADINIPVMKEPLTYASEILEFLHYIQLPCGFIRLCNVFWDILRLARVSVNDVKMVCEKHFQPRDPTKTPLLGTSHPLSIRPFMARYGTRRTGPLSDLATLREKQAILERFFEKGIIGTFSLVFPDPLRSLESSSVFLTFSAHVSSLDEFMALDLGKHYMTLMEEFDIPFAPDRIFSDEVISHLSDPLKWSYPHIAHFLKWSLRDDDGHESDDELVSSDLERILAHLQDMALEKRRAICRNLPYMRALFETILPVRTRDKVRAALEQSLD
jgi:hypothetical protein